jgi:hypothetical protein
MSAPVRGSVAVVLLTARGARNLRRSLARENPDEETLRPPPGYSSDDQEDADDGGAETPSSQEDEPPFILCNRRDTEISETHRWHCVCALCAPGVPTPFEHDPMDLDRYDCHGWDECGRRGLPIEETRVLCASCFDLIFTGTPPRASPPTNLLSLRERTVCPRASYCDESPTGAGRTCAAAS